MAAHCASNLHQIYVGMYQWMMDNGYYTPPPWGSGTGDYGYGERMDLVEALVSDGDAVRYFDDAAVFFCPQHGMNAAEWFSYVYGGGFFHSTYVYILMKDDNRNPGNRGRQKGYHNVIMTDSGAWMYSGGIASGPKGSLKGEHYNCLHYNGNVEVNYARDGIEALEKLGLRERFPTWKPAY
jgi:hypothetical protein